MERLNGFKNEFVILVMFVLLFVGQVSGRMNSQETLTILVSGFIGYLAKDSKHNDNFNQD